MGGCFMRNKLISLLLTGVMLLAVGCQTSSKPLEQAKKPEQTTDSTKYPAEVRNWLSNMKSYLVAGVVEEDNKTYLLVSGGEQRTGGHEVKITGVNNDGNQLTVHVNMTKPDGPAAQVISYPYAVHVLGQEIGDNKKVVFINSANNERIPQVIGEQPTEPFLDGSNSIKIIEMELDKNEIDVEGIARVDNPAIHYRFTNGEGKTLSEGKVTAAATAPDWGSFELDDVKRPQGATHIEFYWVDAKDQSQRDKVRIAL